MKNLDWLEISSFLGLGAAIFLTIHYLLGMLMASAYKKSQYWKKIPQYLKKYTVFQWHQMMARVALILIFLHAFILIFTHSPKFTLANIFVPGNAPQNEILIALGNLSFYGLLLLFITSLADFRKRISFRAWKNIHLGAYILTPLFIMHGLLLDPQLKERQVDWLDGEKLISLVCAIVILTATFFRCQYSIKYSIRHRKNESRLNNPDVN